MRRFASVRGFNNCQICWGVLILVTVLVLLRCFWLHWTQQDLLFGPLPCLVLLAMALAASPSSPAPCIGGSSSLLGTTFLGICTRCWEDSSHVGSSWTFGGLFSRVVRSVSASNGYHVQCSTRLTHLKIHVCTETESWAKGKWKGCLLSITFEDFSQYAMSKVVFSDGFNDFRAATWRCPEMN